jgi:hypothetical protein
MILKIWSSFLLLLVNLIFFLDLLPRMINADSTELVLLSPIVTMMVLTADYYEIKRLRKWN